MRGGEVAVEEGRREIADVYVVESVSTFVVREKRLGINVECEEIANGVLIFGAVESTQGFRATWVRTGCCCGVEFGGEPV